MAGKRSSSQGTWVVAGAIVLVGLLVVGVLVLLLGGSDGDQTASPSATTHSPNPPRTRSPHVRPSRSVTPSPSPTHTRSPSPSPSSEPSEADLVRAVVEQQANIDRPSEVKTVGAVDFYDDREACPQTGHAAATTVRFTSAPRTGIYFLCRSRTRWDIDSGPLYGE